MRFIRRLIARFRRLCARSPRQRRLLAEAILEICRARIFALLPFRWLEPSLGTRMVESYLSVEPEHAAFIADVRWAVVAASAHTPWRTTCLMSAVAVQRMLGRREIPTTLYLGLCKDDPEQLVAHAWIRCGRDILVGEAEHEEFTVVATYASPAEPASTPHSR